MVLSVLETIQLSTFFFFLTGEGVGVVVVVVVVVGGMVGHCTCKGGAFLHENKMAAARW